MLLKEGNFKFTLFYWILVIPTFLVISYRTLFLDVQIQNYYFNELEDFGRYVFYLGVSFVESFIYIFIIRVVVGLLQSFFNNTNAHS